jgi:hypothetical protein
VYVLQLSHATGFHPTKLEFRTTRQVGAQWFTEAGDQERWVRLVGRLEQVNPQGQSVFQVAQVVLLDAQGRAEKTLPVAHPTGPSLAPTLGEVDATPDAYARRTVLVRAGLRAGFVTRGGVCELQVVDEQGVRPANLSFQVARALAGRWSDEGRPEQPVPVDLAIVVTREKADGRTVAEVTEIVILDRRGVVVKSLP